MQSSKLDYPAQSPIASRRALVRLPAQIGIIILTFYFLDATSFLYQLGVVVRRNNLALWRSPEYIFTRLFISAFVSLFVSLSLLQLGNSKRDLQFRIFSMYASCLRCLVVY